MTKPDATAGPPPSYPIESVDSALKLLLLLADRGRLRIADGARELGVARSTAHRLMQMLQYHGMAVQDTESKAYLPGPALLSAGLRVVRNLDVRHLARPHLEALVEAVDETAHLLALHGTEVLCLDSVETPRSVRVGARTGMVMPLQSSATGRALLARMEPSVADDLCGQLTKPGRGTAPSQRELKKQVRLTRERGYAVQVGEMEADVAAVSAAVPNSRGGSSFAITVSVPLARMDDSDVLRLAAATVACATAVAAELPF